MKKCHCVASEEINSDKSLNKVKVDHWLYTCTETHFSN